jgi:hypothetical protein
VTYTDFFEDFTLQRVELEQATLLVRHGGSGSPVLLLHGHPRTHTTWHRLAPLLAQQHTVVCPDLRGYGESSKPPSDDRHTPYSKRAMAGDCVELMHALGHERFAVERCFELLGEEVDDSPCPAIEGMAKEGKASIKKTDDSVVDAVILSSATESEHHEIAVYETLITNAEARGASEVAGLLRENLEQEKHALEVARSAMKKIASEGIAVGAPS